MVSSLKSAGKVATLGREVSTTGPAPDLASTLDEAIRAGNGAFSAVEAGGALVAQLRGHQLDHDSVAALFEYAARHLTELQMRLGELRRAGPRAPEIPPTAGPRVVVTLRIPDDQLQYAHDIPMWALQLPPGSPVPRVGEVVYLSSTSAWAVGFVVHERLSRELTRVECVISYMGAARYLREPGTPLQ